MLVGGGINAMFGAFNNWLSSQFTQQDRQLNYEQNELAAQNADARTRALYQDFYSPQALMKQYKEAGLSPSMMFGGTPGQGGTPGAQAAGAAGLQTMYSPMNIIEGAQLANLKAQTEKVKAETKNIEKDTDIKTIEEEMQELMKSEYKVQYTLAMGTVINDSGEDTSLYQIAEECKTFGEFRQIAQQICTGDMRAYINSEKGNKILRDIFTSTKQFETNIKQLTTEGENADFQKNVIKCLRAEEYEKKNAETVLKELEAAGQSADLTMEQKKSWNDIIKKLREKNSTLADITIVAAMVLGQLAGKANVSASISKTL